MPPVSLLIKPVSGRCNMSCRYCFYCDVAENRETAFYDNMTLSTLENIVRKALAYAEGFAAFAFQGGEPTLAGLSFYKELVRLQKLYNRRNIAVYNSLQTNGLAINDEWAEFLTENGFLVGLSLDGTEAVHNALRVDKAGAGTYGRVVKAAEILEKHKTPFNILCVVTANVAKNAKDVYNALKKYRFLQFIPCLDGFDGTKSPYSLTPTLYGEFLKTTFELYRRDFDKGRYVSVRNFDNYIQILLGNPPENCSMNGVCGNYVLIEGDGSCFPCDFYVLDEWKTGSINTDSFERLAKSDNARRFIEASRHVSDRCRTCEWFSLCRGGCRRNREPFSEGLPVLNEYCESFRALFERCSDGMKSIAAQVASQQRG